MSKNPRTLPPDERRHEPRHASSSTVRLSLDGPPPQELELQLMDVSKSGFRTTDNGADLQSGECVRFRHLEGSGRARVVWHRVMPDHTETGFLVLGSA